MGTASPFESGLWKDPALAGRALEGLRRLMAGRAAAVNVMEVCGTHTMAIAASGLRRLLPPGLRMLSGPGCPVCVTAPGDVDRIVHAARLPGVILASFGDMLKVKGSSGSLDDARAEGADVRVVYSPLDALALAQREPGRHVVFAGVGFETTIPTVGAAVLRAEAAGIENFSVLALFKTVPAALRAVLSDPGHCIHGFLLPGHVSAIIGLEPYAFAAQEYGVPCVVAGFEPLDILRGLNLLLEQSARKSAEVANEYDRSVKPQGNPRAREVIRQVFEPCDAVWRAVGNIPASGLGLRPAYARFDALRRFDIPYVPAPEPEGCLCGQVLMGKARPSDCGLFGKACTPADAVGPCMVSSEGACAAWYKYGTE